MKDPTATRYESITYTEALSKRLAVMDATAFSLCQDNKVPIIVFDMNQPNNILARRVRGKGGHVGGGQLTDGENVISSPL